MSTLEDKELRQRLDGLSERLRRLTEEFQTKGEFSENQRVLIDRVRHQGAELGQKVVDAAQHGTVWEMTKAELWRDYEALVNEVLLFEQGTDSEARRKS